jgi:hypothetical protein
LAITKNEEGEIESTSLRFPDLDKMVTAPGDAVLKALDAINQWGQNRNIL